MHFFLFLPFSLLSPFSLFLTLLPSTRCRILCTDYSMLFSLTAHVHNLHFQEKTQFWLWHVLFFVVCFSLPVRISKDLPAWDRFALQISTYRNFLVFWAFRLATTCLVESPYWYEWECRFMFTNDWPS